VGLPIPLAASVLITLVMYHQGTFAGPLVRGVNVMVLTLVLSYLMVSNVRYRSFKKLQPSPRVLITIGLVLASFVAVAVLVRATFALFLFFSGYVVLGMLEEVVFFRRRRREDRSRADTSGDSSTPPV
jgi:CDP-diacylglycerol--serine O-phosphatidyltransferase